MVKRQEAQDLLLHLLQEAAPKFLSGKYLASALSVTTRTVRNYVSALTAEGYTITSSKTGYRFEKGVLQRRFAFNSDSLNIIHALLYDRRQRVTRVALAVNLHISEATLDRRLSELSEFLQGKNITLKSKSGEVYLQGSELAKRHLMYLLLDQESQQNILKEFTLPEEQQLGLKKILLETTAKHHLHLDSGTLNNILLHLSIALYRITHTHQIDISINERIHKQLINTGAMTIAQEIATQIKSNFDIQMPTPEIDNIGLLLLDSLHASQPNETQLKDLVAPRFYLLALLLLKNIDDTYSLSLTQNTTFISRFALHIQNLYTRLKANIEESQPVKKTIKKKFPFIYDIAVFICAQISDIFEQRVPESEIDFIAMHIGTLLMSTTKPQPVSFYLVDKNYLNSNRAIVEKLHSKFGNTISISKVFQTYSALPKEIDYSRVLGTAIPVPSSQVLQLSPFIDQRDVDAIQRRIKQLNDRSNSDKILHYIETFLPESLVFREKYFDNASGCISWLCDQMQSAGLVEPAFKSNVLKREALSSTSFIKDIAVPHPLKPMTQQTSLALILNQAPMKWGDSSVRVVLLLGLSPNDHQKFQSIFDAFISVLSNEETVESLLAAEKYADIIKILRDNVVFAN
ncbi:PRD domain-containing protein [Lacticaseibacillus parahuelsenbergensis]|uniref:PRD domain-containing protein n=1 Tax=Lacticaseibacillus parahuelsenbergensis TaxID=3068305 RepID=A0ABY9L4I9_9LACO|nr:MULTISPECIES: PRD domain-containing protein [Lacticaseibacillus]MDE3281718.1 PRD domain-containing protein [Lacticaseibacillus casei]WLV78652.1 PRD domain-containing protein [Lacticaseibacillus sp. NCIMB 15471]